MSTYFAVADPEYNLGRVLEGGEGEGTGGVSPAVGWGSGASPEKILKKFLLQRGDGARQFSPLHEDRRRGATAYPEFIFFRKREQTMLSEKQLSANCVFVCCWVFLLYFFLIFYLFIFFFGGGGLLSKSR